VETFERLAASRKGQDKPKIRVAAQRRSVSIRGSISSFFWTNAGRMANEAPK
jgi:hypothetical protein